MKICMLIRSMPAHGRGGMEDHAFTLSRTLVRRGHSVTVITTKHPEGIGRETIDGVDIVYLANTWPRHYFGGWWKKSAEAFLELNAMSKFDVIHSQGVAAYGILKRGTVAASGLPVVISLHGTSLDEIKSKFNIGFAIEHPARTIRNIASLVKFIYFFLVVERICLKKADRVIATSREQVTTIKKFHLVPPEKIMMVLNGIDVDHFSPPARQDLPRENGLILSVARLVEDKGIEFIIRAMPSILKSAPHAMLEIVGDGRIRTYLEGLARNLGVEKEVKVLGYVEYSRLPEYYRKAEVFANPTIRIDGYDLTILQAMSAECPVVTTNIGSVPTVAKDGVNCLLVPPKNVDELAAAVLRIFTDKDLVARIALAGRKDVTERFSLESMATGTEEAYRVIKTCGHIPHRRVDTSNTILNPSFINRTTLAKGLIKARSYVKGRLLDIGCGAKPYKNLFDVNEYIGVDLPTTESKSQVIDVYAGATMLPFRDGVFDTVLCTQVLEHVSEPHTLLKEANRVLKEGGFLVLTAPQTWGVHEAPYDFYRFTVYGLEYLSRANGFEPVSITKTCGVWATAGQRISGVVYWGYGARRNIVIKSLVVVFCAFLQSVAVLLDIIFSHAGDTLNNVLVARKGQTAKVGTEKVLFISSSHVMGGAERYLINIAKGLDRSLFYPIIAGPSGTPLLEEAEALGLDVRDFHFGPKISKNNLWDIVFWPVYFVRIKRLIESLKKYPGVDIAHFHFKKGQLIGSIAAYMENIPVVWTEHSPIRDFFKGIFGLVLKVYSVLGKKCVSKIIVYSERSLSDMKKIGIPEAKIAMINTGITLEAYKDIREPFSGVKKPPVIGCMCRLEPFKGVDFLIRAIPLILAKEPHARFLILGSGSEADRLKRLADRLSIGDKVVLKGWVPSSSIPEAMKEIDIFVHPSLRGEGTPFAVMEALAACKAVIVSDVGGMRALIENNVTGLLIPPLSSEAIADAVLRLLCDRGFAKKIALNGRAKVFRCHNSDDMAQSVGKVFIDVIEGWERI